MSKVTTKTEVRLSYTYLITPRAQDEEKPNVLTYSTAILIPKSDKATVKEIQAAIKEALADGVAKKWGGKTPKGLRNPMRDGDVDRPDDENYAGCFFINAKGPRGGAEKPILLDKRGQETDEVDVIYSGVFARVSLQFYPYDKAGNRGVACGISSVLSMEHGEPLGNTVTPATAREEFGVTTSAEDAAKDFDSNDDSDESESTDEADPWTA
jgi:hypothetical protein